MKALHSYPSQLAKVFTDEEKRAIVRYKTTGFLARFDLRFNLKSNQFEFSNQNMRYRWKVSITLEKMLHQSNWGHNLDAFDPSMCPIVNE